MEPTSSGDNCWCMQVTKYNLKNSMLPKLHIGLFLLSNHVKLD
jgi:hypothetical protein